MAKTLMKSEAKVCPPEWEQAFGTLERARDAGGRGARLVLAGQAVKTALRLGFSGLAAVLVGRLVMGQAVESWQLFAAATLLLLLTLAARSVDRARARIETDLAIRLRGEIAERLASMPAWRLTQMPAGSLAVSLQRHPEALAAFAISHRVASMMMGLGPLMAAAALALVSWQAALMVLCLTPVMIVFFALVGGVIRERADQQERAFGALAGQFADRMRTLPTILASHALGREERKLGERMRQHAGNTMSVLRIAFVNAGIIDFFSSLSIAMLAVFLGLGHLNLVQIPGFSHLELQQSLFILMIAPDYFAPFRQFSEQYHAKAEGLAAAAAVDRLLNEYSPAPAAPLALDRVFEPLPARGLVAITGPSGCGKSTLLRRIAGVEGGDGMLPVTAVGAKPCWIAMDSYIAGDTLAQAIAWDMGDICPTRLRLAAAQVGLMDDDLLPDGLETAIGRGGVNLSGGQRLRVSIARASLAPRIVLADEPTAKLDPASAVLVRRRLLAMAQTRLVIVATHDPALAGLAQRVVDLAPVGTFGVAA